MGLGVLLLAVEPCKSVSSTSLAHWQRSNLHRGVDTVTCIWKAGLGMLSALLGMKPDWMPFCIAVQGAVKLDCVRVWFSDWKLNCTMSPTLTLSVFGV